MHPVVTIQVHKSGPAPSLSPARDPWRALG